MAYSLLPLTVAFVSLTAAITLPLAGASEARMPRLVGDWWQIAGDPDLGELTDDKQQPVDFGIWQAADGSWQLWSCIRNTRETGKTRLFYRWEGGQLTDSQWKAGGIALRAETRLGETAGGLQAPFVLKDRNQFLMFYGDWTHICAATSSDGKNFKRRVGSSGGVGLFGEGLNSNARDPMVLRIGERWHCYYTAHPGGKGSVYCRTSTNTLDWTDPKIVAAGGSAGDGPYSAECPFVVAPKPGQFFLFRTQRYLSEPQTSVYFSTDPFDFGVNNDGNHFLGTLPVAAPEILQHDGVWYLAALLPSLKGVRVVQLEWANDR